MKTAIMFVLNRMEQYPDKKKNPSFNFFGGEPMLHFEDIIKPTILWCEEEGLVDKYNIGFGMTTNGTLLNEENLKWLSQHKVGILLSMDGDKETQDSQRPGANGSSSFDMLAPKLSTILRYYPYTTFRSAVEPFNADKIYENYLFARRNNFINYFITPNVSANWTMEDIQTALGQLSLIAETLYQDITNHTVPLMWNELITDMRECFYKDVPRSYEISYSHCGIGTNSIGVATNGDIYGCQEHNTYVDHDIFYIGNIFTGIDPVKHKRLLEEFKKEKHPVCKDMPELCDTCSFYKFCSGHYCPSHNFGKGSAIVENSLVTCLWKRFMSDLAHVILEQAEAEKNEEFLRFLEARFKDGNTAEFSVW
jgi:uncharacterized protein